VTLIDHLCRVSLKVLLAQTRPSAYGASLLHGYVSTSNWGAVTTGV
jgi:hypothetical protein